MDARFLSLTMPMSSVDGSRVARGKGVGFGRVQSSVRPVDAVE